MARTQVDVYHRIITIATTNQLLKLNESCGETGASVRKENTQRKVTAQQIVKGKNLYCASTQHEIRFKWVKIGRYFPLKRQRVLLSSKWQTKYKTGDISSGNAEE